VTSEAHSFKYDPFGRRIYKSSSTATSIYAYDGDNLIEETNSSGAVVARYEPTQNIDEPLAMLRSGATSYFHADGLGSITSLSNSAGTIANTYTYDSYGNLTASTGTLVNSFRYTARESDPETGLYYYRARYYDSTVGRFIKEDPIRLAGRDLNFYRYVWNSSHNFRDPLGLVGVGLSLGAGGFAGLGPGVAGQGSIGSMWFPYPKGDIKDVGGYLTYGGVVGSHGLCKPYDNNQTGGLSASAGLGVVFSNANSLPDISGPFNNTSYTFLVVQLDFAYSPDNGVWTLNISEGFGLGFSKYVTNTLTNPTSPPQGCRCN
jgi:RHS repeat-associated protein